MTNKSLLATAAAIALLAGPHLASAQGTSQGSEPKASSAPMKADVKPKAEPSSAQKMPESSAKPAQSTQAPADAAKAKSETTGQAAPSSQPQTRAAPSSTQSPTSTQSQPGTTAPAQAPATTTQAPASGTTTTTQGQTGSSVSLNPQQRAEIQSTVLASAPKVSDVNFSLNVGTVVPRTVRVVEVHPTLVKIYPQWRGHMYFVVGDRIIIVERNTLRIVAVITV